MLCSQSLSFIQFYRQLEPPKLYKLFSSAMPSVARVLFWSFFMEFVTHYLYAVALLRRPDLLQSVDQFTQFSLGYYTGQLYMVKYLVMYSLPAAIAKLDDLDPPGVPKCISRIYLYSDMWK